MPRSYRKNFVFPVCCCQSQKKWKQEYSRIYRSKTKSQLQKAVLNDNIDYNLGTVYKHHFADIWLSPSDGKMRFDFLNEDEFKNPYSANYYSSYKEYKKDFKKNYSSK